MNPTARANPFAGPLEVEAILAIGSLIVFAAALSAVLFQIVPAANEKYVMLMLGALIGVVKDTFGRYFQATKGSQEQRQDLTNLARAATDSVNKIAEGAAPTLKAAPPVVVVPTPAPAPVGPTEVTGVGGGAVQTEDVT